MITLSFLSAFPERSLHEIPFSIYFRGKNMKKNMKWRADLRSNRRGQPWAAIGLFFVLILGVGFVAYLISKGFFSENTLGDAVVQTELSSFQTEVSEEKEEETPASSGKTDEKWVEIDYVEMPKNQQSGDWVDVRIRFANGEDYTVLTDVRVLSVYEKACMLELKEEEILRLSSALVDQGSCEGSRLYAVTLPTGQSASIVNYPLRSSLYALWNNNPNLDTPLAALWEEERLALEIRQGMVRTAWTEGEE